MNTNNPLNLIGRNSTVSLLETHIIKKQFLSCSSESVSDFSYKTKVSDIVVRLLNGNFFYQTF